MRSRPLPPQPNQQDPSLHGLSAGQVRGERSSLITPWLLQLPLRWPTWRFAETPAARPKLCHPHNPQSSQTWTRPTAPQVSRLVTDSRACWAQGRLLHLSLSQQSGPSTHLQAYISLHPWTWPAGKNLRNDKRPYWPTKQNETIQTRSLRQDSLFLCYPFIWNSLPDTARLVLHYPRSVHVHIANFLLGLTPDNIFLSIVGR